MSLKAIIFLLFCFFNVHALELDLVTHSSSGAVPRGRNSSAPELSADGHWLVFVSDSDLLVTNRTQPGVLNAFLRDNISGEIRLVTQGTNSTPANGNSFRALISADGAVVLVESDANNLAPGDENDATDLYLYDVASETITLINPGSNGNSGAASITPNGRFVLYESDASNLSPLDTNTVPDVYLFDRETKTNVLVTANSDNSAASGGGPAIWAPGTFQAEMSDDARYVVYLSTAQDVVPGLAGFRATPQVYLRDTEQNENTLLSKDSRGTPSGQTSSFPGTRDAKISGDGRWVVFTSQSFLTTNILGGYDYTFDILSNSLSLLKVKTVLGVIPGERNFSGNAQYLAYVHGDVLYIQNLADGATRFLTSNDGSVTNLAAADLLFSRNGRYLLYRSAVNAVATNDLGWQAYVFDQETGTNFLLGTAFSNNPPGEPVVGYTVSDTGEIAFATAASDLGVDGDPTGNDIFRQKIGDTVSLLCASKPLPGLVSSTSEGRTWVPPNALSADGRYLVFASDSPDFVPNDTNGVRDLFLYDFASGTNRIVSLSTSGQLRTRGSELIGMSSDARKIAYFSHEADEFGTSILVYDVDKNVTTLESFLPSGERAFVGTHAALSADGQSLAFFVGNQFFIRTLSQDKTEPVTISDSETTPFLSVSGRYFVGARPGHALRIVDRATSDTWDSPFEVPAASERVVISVDESTLLFFSGSSGTKTADLYSLSLPAKTLTLISTNTVPPTALNANGATAFFQTSGGSNAPNRIYAYDLRTQTSSLLPLDDSRPYELTGNSVLVSDDGRFLILSAHEYVDLPGTRQAPRNLYLFDRVLTNITALRPGTATPESGGPSADPALSADGHVIAFRTLAENFVQADLNRGVDLFAAHLGIVDENGNGIDDGWELQFTDIGTTDADSDGDGSSNRAEYLAGTNPTSAASALRITKMETSPNGVLVQWNSVRGKHYQIEGSTDLGAGHWESLDIATIATGPATTASLPVEEQRFKFYRVILQL